MPDDSSVRQLVSAPIQIRSDSEQCFGQSKRWLEECQTNHNLCNAPQQSLPSRVIDVGSLQEEPFLYISSLGEEAPWVALSHAWGGEHPLTTTLASLHERCHSIPLGSLPPVFLDAIKITRKLGFKYLWVDSLCIIQDSRADWAVESTKMSDIYSGAALCIVASAASGPSEGIFRSGDRDRHFFQSFAEINPSTESERRRSFFLRRDSRLEWSDSIHVKRRSPIEPLHKRAWVLQESCLSRRSLEFTSRQLRWSCRTSDLTEGSPHTDQDYSIFKDLGRDLFRMPIATTAYPSLPWINATDSMSPLTWWYRTLENLTRRDILYGGDLLPAIAGLAFEFKKRTIYSYVCGLWREDFHKGLLWRSKESGQRVESDSVPSWSWASTTVPQEHGRLKLINILPEHRNEILNLQVETVGEMEFAPVTQASLTMRGKCILLSSTGWIPKYRNYYWLPNIISLVDPQSTSASTHSSNHVTLTLDEEDNTDILYDRLVSRKVICMHVATAREHIFDSIDYEVYYGLLLEASGGEVETFRRIGTMRVPSLHASIDGWPVRTVKLV